jgi:hypothetical protein
MCLGLDHRVHFIKCLVVASLEGIQRHGRTRWRLHEGQGLRREKGGRGRRLHLWCVVLLSKLPWIRLSSLTLKR